MSEQQRIFLSIILCTAIYLGFQVLQPAPPPVETPANSPAVAQLEPEAAVAAAAEGPSQAALAVARAASAVKPAARTFETKLLRGTLKNGDAGLSQLSLTAFQERAAGAGPDVPVSLVAGDAQQLQARLTWHTASPQPVAMDFVDGSSLRLQGSSPEGLRFDVIVAPRQDAYAIDYTLRITNTSQQTQQAGASVGLSLVSKGAQEGREPNFLAKLLGTGKPPVFDAPRASEEVTAVCDLDGSIKRKGYTDVRSAPYLAADKVRWSALDQQYFAIAVMPEAGSTGACTARMVGDTLHASFIFPSTGVAAGTTWEKKFSLYAGPKRDEQLSQVSPALKEIIDYNLLKVPLGSLARPMVWLLNLLHDTTGSWGLAIMLLTVTVKLLLFPVTYKSLTSARRMQALKPELEALKVRFGGDKERFQMEQLKLFREKGVNPVGGCLPMLLQMPVWITLYRTLWSDVDLYQQPFLWLTDLTAREPFPSLAIAVGALTILQQKVTPMATDSEQAKVMMYVMPVMLTGFMVALPSGLVLYILVNSILTILQQLAINKRSAPV